MRAGVDVTPGREPAGADAGPESVEVTSVVDGARFGSHALLVCVLTTLALVFDGFDIQAIGFAAPRLMSDWGIDRAALARILAAGLLGMFVGAFALGVVGDRHGRRRREDEAALPEL